MKNPFLRKLPGIFLTVLLVIILTLFMIILVGTKIIPFKFLLIIGSAFLLLTVCVFFLTRDSRRTTPLIFGCVLMIVVLLLLIVGTSYLNQAVNTLDQITEVETEIAQVGIYVTQDDPAEDVSDLHGYRIGILSDLDRENTDKTIHELEDILSEGLNITAYDGLAELADALLTNDTADAIILNSAYVELLADMEGYENAAERLRELHVQIVETQVEKKPVKNEDRGNRNEESNAFVMYISGIDSRSGLISKSRSDVNILAVVNPDTRQVLLVSTPRDFYVPLPISDGIPDKLTHAGIYGIDVSVGTLEMLYDVDISYYFRVNFSGFENIIDALGGVTVYSDVAFSSSKYSSPNAKYHFTQGENYLDGAAALVFARERYVFSDGDNQRGKNQMAVIKAVIEKALSPALLTNYSAIMQSVSGSFETSMPYDKIAELVRNQLDSGGSWNIVSTSVTGTSDYRVPYSLSTEAYVMIPDQAAVDDAKAKIQQVINGEILQ